MKWNEGIEERCESKVQNEQFLVSVAQRNGVPDCSGRYSPTRQGVEAVFARMANSHEQGQTTGQQDKWPSPMLRGRLICSTHEFNITSLTLSSLPLWLPKLKGTNAHHGFD